MEAEGARVEQESGDVGAEGVRVEESGDLLAQGSGDMRAEESVDLGAGDEEVEGVRVASGGEEEGEGVRVAGGVDLGSGHGEEDEEEEVVRFAGTGDLEDLDLRSPSEDEEGKGVRVAGSEDEEGESVRVAGSEDKEGKGVRATGSGDAEAGVSYSIAGRVAKRRRLSSIRRMADKPSQSWLASIPREDQQHLALLLYARLPPMFRLGKTDTAGVVGEVIEKNERTIRRWVDDFTSNKGEFSNSQQGHYIRNNTLMSNEELCDKARVYVRENAAPRGRPNMTVTSFCQWVNNELLPNSILEPGYPRKVALETARKWLHELGFEVLQMSKGVFIDGHERPDVVESRVEFLKKMTECGFLRPNNAPSKEAAQALPAVPHMSKEEGEKHIVWFHDESAYNTTEDTPTLWGEKGKQPIKPKGRGSSIMVSHFIEEKDGYLALSDEQYDFEVMNTDQEVEKSACVLLEIGENREGYWNSDLFMEQIAKAVKIAEVKYPPSQGYHHTWCFDHSCNHTAFADDALLAAKMNKGPGGKQRNMHDTVWNGQPQTMTLPDGRPKGAELVLRERGYDTKGMKLEEMRAILADHNDFNNEKCRVNALLSNSGHTCIFIPKFHCELNPIERVWSQSKRYTRAYCDYTITSLRQSIPLGLESVSKENIANYVRRCRNYMFAYLEGANVGQELEDKIKFYKTTSYASHRRIGIDD